MSDQPNGAILSADDVEALLTGDDRITIEVYVPEWRKAVRLRQLTAAEGISIAEAPKHDGILTVVALSVVDANGNRLFKDIDRLRGRSAAALARIQTAALKLNGFDTNAVSAAKNA
jgi:hypothetical protein